MPASSRRTYTWVSNTFSELSRIGRERLRLR